MTRVCLVGDGDVNLQYELLSRETARDALATYDLHEPFENAVGVETVSLGAAVSLLNDLNWYLVRFVDEAMVLEPSVSDSEWLSRELATAVRDDEISPAESERFLKVYGLEPPADATEGRDGAGEGAGDGDPPPGPPGSGDRPGSDADDAAAGGAGTGTVESDAGGSAESGPGADSGAGGDDGSGWDDAVPKRLVEPMFVTRTGGDIPDYDLRPVEATVVERVTESEFGA